MPEHDEEHDWMSQIIRRYGRMLQWVLRHQRLAMLVMLATVAFTAVLYLAVPKGFFPVQDSGVIQVVTEAPQDISFAAMAERQQQLAANLLATSGGGQLKFFYWG